jgi:diguanylate cyclase (GGDEF)-like protein
VPAQVGRILLSAIPNSDTSRCSPMPAESELARHLESLVKLTRIGRHLASVSDRAELIQSAVSYLQNDLSYERGFIVLETPPGQSTPLDSTSVVKLPIQFGEQSFGHIVLPGLCNAVLSRLEYETLNAFAAFVAVGLQNVRKLEDIRLIASTDPLTGIFNRRTLLEAGAQTLQRRESTAAIVFDIDHFKAINDKFGHAAGDAMIMAVVRVAKECIRSTDVLARYGGDEFVILLPRTGLQSALQIAHRLRFRMQGTVTQIDSGAYISCTICAGIACVEGEADFSQLIARADEAMYAAKRAGGNNVRFESIPGGHACSHTY